MMMMRHHCKICCVIVDCSGVDPDSTAQVIVKDLNDLVDYCVEDFMFLVLHGDIHIEA